MTCTYGTNNRMLTHKKTENSIEYITKMGYDKNENMTGRQRSSLGCPVGDSTDMEVPIGTMQSNPGSESTIETFSCNATQPNGWLSELQRHKCYPYDADGNRVSKTVNGIEKKYYSDGVDVLNEAVDGQITATNFIGLNGTAGRKTGTDDLACFMKDVHGDVIQVVGEDGAALANYEYDIWGNQMQDAVSYTHLQRVTESMVIMLLKILLQIFLQLGRAVISTSIALITP